MQPGHDPEVLRPGPAPDLAMTMTDHRAVNRSVSPRASGQREASATGTVAGSSSTAKKSRSNGKRQHGHQDRRAKLQSSDLPGPCHPSTCRHRCRPRSAASRQPTSAATKRSPKPISGGAEVDGLELGQAGGRSGGVEHRVRPLQQVRGDVDRVDHGHRVDPEPQPPRGHTADEQPAQGHAGEPRERGRRRLAGKRVRRGPGEREEATATRPAQPAAPGAGAAIARDQRREREGGERRHGDEGDVGEGVCRARGDFDRPDHDGDRERRDQRPPRAAQPLDPPWSRPRGAAAPPAPPGPGRESRSRAAGTAS